MISFTLEIDPVAKGRPRFDRRGIARTPESTRHFENAVRLMLTPYRPKEILSGPIILTVAFYMRPPIRRVRDYPTCAPDTDNLIKALTDSANGVLWKDDAQIVEIHARKLYDYVTRRGRIEVKVEEMKNG